MRRLPLFLVLFLAAPAFAQPDIAGDWQGAIAVGGTELALVVHLAPADGGADGGTYAVTMDVPAQGAYGLPADSAAVAGDTLFFAFSGINASFEGVVAGDAASIAGTWTQGGRGFPLTLTPYEALAGEPVEAPKPGPKPARGDLSGDWAGALAIPGGGEVRLTLHLTRTDGGYEAAVSGPGGERQPFDTATVSGRSVILSNAAPAIEVAGTVSDDETAIEGEWRQGGQKLPVTFTRG